MLISIYFSFCFWTWKHLKAFFWGERNQAEISFLETGPELARSRCHMSISVTVPYLQSFPTLFSLEILRRAGYASNGGRPCDPMQIRQAVVDLVSLCRCFARCDLFSIGLFVHATQWLLNLGCTELKSYFPRQVDKCPRECSGNLFAVRHDDRRRNLQLLWDRNKQLQNVAMP